jgi:hypothetical protein
MDSVAIIRFAAKSTKFCGGIAYVPSQKQVARMIIASFQCFAEF